MLSSHSTKNLSKESYDSTTNLFFALKLAACEKKKIEKIALELSVFHQNLLGTRPA